MNPDHRIIPLPWLRRCVHIGSVIAVTAAVGQVAPSAAPTAAQLAKYDTNRNGVLDPSEAAAMLADAARAAAAVSERGAGSNAETPVQLSPFEVVADTRGYLAEALGGKPSASRRRR